MRWIPQAKSGKAGRNRSHGRQVVTATNTDHSHIAVSVHQISQPTFHHGVLARSSGCSMGGIAMHKGP